MIQCKVKVNKFGKLELIKYNVDLIHGLDVIKNTNGVLNFIHIINIMQLMGMILWNSIFILGTRSIKERDKKKWVKKLLLHQIVWVQYC